MPLFGPPNIEEMKKKRDVRGLIRALNYKEDWQLREAAIRALGELGDASAIKAIGVVSNENVILFSDNEKVRRAARVVLENWKTEDENIRLDALAAAYGGARKVPAFMLEKLGKVGVIALIDKLNTPPHDYIPDGGSDGTTEDRRNAASALGKIGDSRAIEPLLQALPFAYQDPYCEKGSERIEIQDALVKFGSQIQPALEAFLHRGKTDHNIIDHKYMAMSILRKINTPWAISQLRDLQKDVTD